MLKLGYFTYSNFTPSETFIYDLVKSLNADPDINVTLVSGQRTDKMPDGIDIKSIAVGYGENFYDTQAIRMSKIIQIRGKGSEMKMKFRKWVTNRKLNSKNIPIFDIAFVEYANTGVRLMDYFEARKIPFVVHVHGQDITSMPNDTAYCNELKKMFIKAKAFIAASHYMKRRLILLGCNEQKIEVIRLGVDGKLITPLPWERRKKLVPNIIFLGNLVEKKNPIALLHAFRIVKNKIPNAILSIIGSGPLKDTVCKTIENLGLSDSVTMYGTLKRSESFPIINNHWIYAQHSVTSINGDTEGFAISLAEAALHELPVVSTVHNGITENVIDGKTGFLVPEYDYETMAEKIIYLIQHPDIAEQMGKAGREHILQLCEPGKRVKLIKELLFKAVQKQNIEII